MLPRYCPQPPPNRDRWMVSYIDILTIVLMFFLGIAAQSLHQSQPNAQAAAPVPPSPPPLPDTPPAPPPAPEDPPALTRVQLDLRKQGLDLRMTPEGLLISLPQAILFASGQEGVNPEALPLIAHIADVLQPIPNQIRLSGYADSRPIHNRRFKSNWDLAAARSLSIQEILTKRFGIVESRLSIASYGPTHPNSSNDTPGGRAQNRRVEILILNDAEPAESQ